MDIRNLHKNGSWNAPWLPTWRPEDGPHPRKRPRSPCFEALLALLMLMMVACTAVKDPSARWKTSGMDPKLEGEWKEETNDTSSRIKLKFVKQEGDKYALMNNNDKKPLAARTFTRNGRQFLLVLKPEDEVPTEPNGLVMFYEIKNDTLRLSYLDPEVIHQAIQNGRIKGEAPPKKDGAKRAADPALATLDDATCDALAELAKDKDAVKLLAEYKREPKK